MSERVFCVTGKFEKCSGCNGRGYSGSENHPDCLRCNGAGYAKVEGEEE